MPRCCYFSRRYDEAIGELDALLHLEPHLDQALSALGNARIAKGDAQGALTAFRSLLGNRVEACRAQMQPGTGT